MGRVALLPLIVRSMRLSVVQRVWTASGTDSIKVRRLLCGEHSPDVWHVGSWMAPAWQRLGAVRVCENRELTLLCRASCWGAACVTLFRLRHCPASLAVVCLSCCTWRWGDRPTSRAGRRCGGGCVASRGSEKSMCGLFRRPGVGRPFRSGRRLAIEPVAAPPLVTGVRGFASRVVYRA